MGPPLSTGQEPAGTVSRVDSARHIVKITYGEFELTANLYALRAVSARLRALVDASEAELPPAASRLGVQVLLNWLSSGNIEVYDPDNDDEDDDDGGIVNNPEQDDDDDWWTVTVLCEAYKTGEALDVSADFLDAVMDQIVDTVVKPNDRYGERIIDLARVLSKTRVSGSPGRLFVVEWLFHDKFESAEGTFGFQVAEFIEECDAHCS
ncbi:hypothetical protein LTR56_022629 [Elasticomyces elasticus]|nr:hypothetical protein LTR56_022629 [Elasticomyces elasticus]KAK3628404.1 hypothetical protein LTR22_022365 [Elasticomyces elasticus]KAK4905772.1 hypothetical protein LTR49_024978 [Elasticomyces elasticus]KAK5743234.1 hypothetical protein LTS12_023922 [Elasticomyces elasticus]